jgi:hypothetical protein
LWKIHAAPLTGFCPSAAVLNILARCKYCCGLEPEGGGAKIGGFMAKIVRCIMRMARTRYRRVFQNATV